MSNAMQEYLKKYMSPADGDKTTKKKRRMKKRTNKSGSNGMKIIDDDVGWDTLNVKSDEDEEKYLMKEEKPQVLDEKDFNKNYRDTTKWKTFGADADKQQQRHDSDSDGDHTAIATTCRHDSDSDGDNPVAAPHRHDSDSDMEVPRQKSNVEKSDKKSKKTRWQQQDSGSEKEVPRQKSSSAKPEKKSRKSRWQKQESDSDLEVPRMSLDKRQHKPTNRQVGGIREDESDSDLDLPRGKPDNADSDSDLDVPREESSNKRKMESGGSGGLISLQEHRKEIAKTKKKESNLHQLAEQFKSSDAVYRERGSAKKRDLASENKDEEEKLRKKKKIDDRYAAWASGGTQAAMRTLVALDRIHEESKPFARYGDDEDLDKMLREREDEEDPMAKFIKKKKEKNNKATQQFPRYQGPPPAPNRFQIPPGYRWDGVDRFNGFETRYFLHTSETSAAKNDYYKWSVNDM